MKSSKTILFATNSSRHAWQHRGELANAALKSGYLVYFACPYGEEVKKLESLGIQHIELKLNRKSLNPLIEFLTFLNLFKIISNLKPDIFHGFTIKVVLYGGLACRVLKTPIYLLNITGLGSLFLKTSVAYKWIQCLVGHLYRFTFNSPRSLAIFQNTEDQNYFISQGWTKPSQAVLIPGTGINCHSIYPKFENHEPPIILFTGRIIKDKGISELISACHILNEKKYNFRLHLCGELDRDNPSTYSKKEWKNLTQANFIYFFGYQSDLEKFYQACDIFCLPSYREGLPLSLIEAGAYGKPSVVTNIPGCNDIIKNKENGFLVSVKSVPELVLALEHLLMNPQLRISMGKVARKVVEENFDQDRLLKKYMQIYRSKD